MSWLERARRVIGELAHSASAGARQLQLDLQIGRLEQERERQFAEAGRRARTLYRAGRIADDELGVILKRIDELDAALEQLRAEAVRLRGRGGPYPSDPP
jgi:hypothetical protein